MAYYAVSPAALVVAASTERRGTMFGLVVGLGCGSGLVLGPTVAQLLGWRAAFGVEAVALTAVAAAWSVLWLGLSGAGAAGLLTVASVGFTIGMVGGGVVSDRLGRGRVLVTAALTVAASLAGLAGATPATVWPWAVLFGTALGATITARSTLWADLFAGPRLGCSVGILAAGYPLGAATVTIGGAAWIDTGGGFTWLFASGVAAALGWAGLVYFVTTPTRSGDRQASDIA